MRVVKPLLHKNKYVKPRGLDSFYCRFIDGILQSMSGRHRPNTSMAAWQAEKLLNDPKNFNYFSANRMILGIYNAGLAFKPNIDKGNAPRTGTGFARSFD